MSKQPSQQEPGILESIDSYWFGKGSPTAIGLFRILMGTLCLVNLLMIALDWDAWFSESGYVPAWLGRMWVGGDIPIWGGGPTIPRINLLNGVENAYLSVGFYILIVLASITTILGLWTRVSTILLAIGIVTLHHRNSMILHGGDSVLRIMVLYLAIAPSGAACSLDRLIRLWRGKEGGAPVRVSLWPQRLIAYNMALIYFTTIWLKWNGNLWRDGTATWYPARLAEFYRFPVPDFVNDLPFVYLTTYGTLIVEFSLGTIVFYRPARKYVLAAGILMHFWIDYSMNIPLFSFLMVSMYVCFYEGEEIQAWAQRVGQRLKRFAATVWLPAGKQLDPRGVAFFDAADPLKFLTYQAGENSDLGSAEVRKSKTRSLAAWGFAWIPGLWRKLLLKALVPVENPPLPSGKRAKASKEA